MRHVPEEKGKIKLGGSMVHRKLADEAKQAIFQVIDDSLIHGEFGVHLLKRYVVSLLENQHDSFWEKEEPDGPKDSTAART